MCAKPFGVQVCSTSTPEVHAFSRATGSKIAPYLLSSALSSAMVARHLAHRRVPMSAREVVIIRRLKKVVKLPVTKIAQAVDRHKTTVAPVAVQQAPVAV